MTKCLSFAEYMHHVCMDVRRVQFNWASNTALNWQLLRTNTPSSRVQSPCHNLTIWLFVRSNQTWHSDPASIFLSLYSTGSATCNTLPIFGNSDTFSAKHQVLRMKLHVSASKLQIYCERSPLPILLPNSSSASGFMNWSSRPHIFSHGSSPVFVEIRSNETKVPSAKLINLACCCIWHLRFSDKQAGSGMLQKLIRSVWHLKIGWHFI